MAPTWQFARLLISKHWILPVVCSFVIGLPGLLFCRRSAEQWIDLVDGEFLACWICYLTWQLSFHASSKLQGFYQPRSTAPKCVMLAFWEYVSALISATAHCTSASSTCCHVLHRSRARAVMCCTDHEHVLSCVAPITSTCAHECRVPSHQVPLTRAARRNGVFLPAASHRHRRICGSSLGVWQRCIPPPPISSTSTPRSVSLLIGVCAFTACDGCRPIQGGVLSPSQP
jgi:hypothetical protein